jgi:hypothetical protein
MNGRFGEGYVTPQAKTAVQISCEHLAVRIGSSAKLIRSENDYRPGKKDTRTVSGAQCIRFYHVSRRADFLPLLVIPYFIYYYYYYYFFFLYLSSFSFHLSGTIVFHFSRIARVNACTENESCDANGFRKNLCSRRERTSGSDLTDKDLKKPHACTHDIGS